MPPPGFLGPGCAAQPAAGTSRGRRRARRHPAMGPGTQRLPAPSQQATAGTSTGAPHSGPPPTVPP
eukprot:5146288-Pyramimonas_sp.AAC.1